MDGLLIYEDLVHQLVDDGLKYKEIASAINIDPDVVRTLNSKGRNAYKNLKKYRPKWIKEWENPESEFVSVINKINKEEFIKLWKNNVPYSVIAHKFGIPRQAAMHYKSKECKGITKKVMCYSCGTVFETDRANRGLCDGCSFEHDYMSYFHYLKKERMKKGDELRKERVESECQRELEKQKKRAEKAERRIWGDWIEGE